MRPKNVGNKLVQPKYTYFVCEIRFVKKKNYIYIHFLGARDTVYANGRRACNLTNVDVIFNTKRRIISYLPLIFCQVSGRYENLWERVILKIRQSTPFVFFESCCVNFKHKHTHQLWRGLKFICTNSNKILIY